MIKKKRAVLLVNVGTPDKPTVQAVRRYLTQFLNDARVIDLPWIVRKILVNLIIVPFRAPKSTKLYQQLWTEQGSPLLYYLNNLTTKLQLTLGDDRMVMGAMRYGNPSLKKALKTLKTQHLDELIILPLFPHYASSSTGTVKEFIMKELAKWESMPDLKFIGQFYDHPAFLDAFEQQIRNHHYQDFDHILFSYHGLPLRQIEKVHPEKPVKTCSCQVAMPLHGSHCYRATCYETSRLLARRLNLQFTDYSVSFQSRLSEKWIQPFTDKHLVELAQKGVKRLLVAAPSFVADCLETKVEIGIEYAQTFKKAGGESLVLVESLNDSDLWVAGLAEIIGGSARI